VSPPKRKSRERLEITVNLNALFIKQLRNYEQSQEISKYIKP